MEKETIEDQLERIAREAKEKEEISSLTSTKKRRIPKWLWMLGVPVAIAGYIGITQLLEKPGIYLTETKPTTEEVQTKQTKKKITPETKNLESTLQNINSYEIMEKGKYLINFDITIHEQGTLEIEPGTELYFKPNAGIVSYGTLKATGTEKEKILFTASGERWKNITIADKLGRESVLEYCQIEKGRGRDRVMKLNYPFKVKKLISDHTVWLEEQAFGGALFILEADVKIRNCEIIDNEGTFGGGICIKDGTIVVEKSTLTGNKASDGGGIAIYRSKATLNDNLVKNNEGNLGGGIYIYNSYLGSISNNSFIENYAAVGGGLYFGSSNIPIVGNTITGNTASFSGGGGIDLNNSHPRIERNIITYNKASIGGGGLALDKSNPFLLENTIEGNISSGSKAGSMWIFKSQPRGRGNIIRNNTPPPNKYFVDRIEALRRSN